MNIRASICPVENPYYITSNKTCVDQCPIAHYFNPTCNTCQLCSMTNCIACTSSDICTQCVNDNYIVSEDKKSCVCNNAAGYWQDGDKCTKCSKLIKGCLTCQSKDVCAVCNESKKFTKDGDICICQSGKVLKKKDPIPGCPPQPV